METTPRISGAGRFFFAGLCLLGFGLEHRAAQTSNRNPFINQFEFGSGRGNRAAGRDGNPKRSRTPGRPHPGRTEQGE
jgi:hypothetical protein